MTAPSVVPTLRHHTPENRPFDEFLAASCESRANGECRLSGLRLDPTLLRQPYQARL
jgi:hypothetical protein